jgi:hypothetical protein
MARGNGVIVQTADGPIVLTPDTWIELVRRLQRYCRPTSQTLKAFETAGSGAVVLDDPGRLTVLTLLERWLEEEGADARPAALVELRDALAYDHFATASRPQKLRSEPPSAQRLYPSPKQRTRSH